MNVTTLLNAEYKKWTPAKNYLISTQTGSGKTYFVIHSLLMDAINNEKFLVFVCNRNALLQQTLFEIDKAFQKQFPDPADREKYKRYFKVVTYQYFEKNQRFPNFTMEYSNDYLELLDTPDTVWNCQ